MADQRGMIMIPVHLATPMHAFNYGQGCPIYRAGSMAQARRPCPRGVVVDAQETLMGIYDTLLARYELALARGQKAGEIGDDLETLEMILRGLNVILGGADVG